MKANKPIPIGERLLQRFAVTVLVTALTTSVCAGYEPRVTFIAPDVEATTYFGISVAGMGDHVLIGGLSFPEGSIQYYGQVFLYDKHGNWIRTFEAPDLSHRTVLGSVVYVSSVGERVLLGVPGMGTGRVYLFENDGNLLHVFLPPDTPAPGSIPIVEQRPRTSYFGQSLTALGENILIGARYGVGQAFLFDQIGELLQDFESPEDDYWGWADNGCSVAAFGDKVLIGAQGVTVDGKYNAGRAYMFTQGGDLLRVFEAPEPEAYARFGWSIASVGNSILVAELDRTIDGIAQAGRVYLFDESGTLLQSFDPPVPQEQGCFGFAIAATGDNILIGTFAQTVDELTSAGEVYLFDQEGTLLQTFRAPVPQPGACFGYSVATVGQKALIGAFGNEVDNVEEAGQVYLFSLIPDPVTIVEPGTNIQIQPIDQTTGEPSPVTLTFDEVTEGGEVTVASSGTGQPPPNSFRLGQPPVYYQISTAAEFEGEVKICIYYGDMGIRNEDRLRLFHRTDAGWVDITTSLNTEEKVICGTTSSFSWFALFIDISPENLLITSLPPVEPYPVGTEFVFAGEFGYPAGYDLDHTVRWIFQSAEFSHALDDSVVGETEFNSMVWVEVEDSCTFAVPGVYSVRLEVTNQDGDTWYATFVDNTYVVIYDPTAGFVTGGGWIWSPSGAFHPELDEFAEVEGRATFGFVSRYQRGATVPTGNTQFQFRAGNLNFSSTAYQWLVIAGARAQYKGWGTIKGNPETYAFLLTGIDGSRLGGGKHPDRFRIKIWNETSGTIIYDNQPGADDNAELTDHTVLGGGSIVIHAGR